MKRIILFIILALSASFTFGQNIEEFKNKAEKGDIYSQIKLGDYFTNKGKPDLAINWYLRAAINGAAIAQYQLALFYHEGKGTEKDESLAFTWGLKAAKQGLPFAQYFIASFYQNGIGVDKNLPEAITWWKRCAEQENNPTQINYEPVKRCIGEAQFKLGFTYGNGIGVETDTEQAFDWMCKSARNGYPDGMWGVGYSYLTGTGVAQDGKKAYEWLTKAAEQNSSSGQYWLSNMFYDGKYIKQDEQKAFYWCEKAAEQGNLNAEFMLGSLYYNQGIGTKQDYKIANEWLAKAAEQDYPPALTNLGWAYYLGEGVSIDYPKALRLFSKAADQDFPDGFNGIAYCKFYGSGTEKDENEAIRLIDKAIELSNNDERFLDTKGEFYCKLGLIDKAKEIYEQIIKRDATYYKDSHSFLSDYFSNLQNKYIDNNIPQSSTVCKNTFAVIISNETYQNEKAVPYASNDGKVFAEYCQKTLGVPKQNVHLIKDATLNNIKYEIKWLQDVINVYNGDAHVIFYYAGHGIPDEKNKSAYLLPVDGYGSDVTTGYSLDDLYKALGSLPSKSVTVFLDACFSGANRDGDMLASARGVAIKVKSSSPIGNMVVFTAAQGDETAYPYKEEGHGLFTYYLLKKLQETKGDVTLGELGDYIQTQVKRQSVVINGKLQSPSILVSPNIGNNWKSWKLK